MPEAAMHKDHGVPAGKYEIGTPGKVGSMKAKPEAGAMKVTADNTFGSGVLSADTRHHPAPCLAINYVSHGQATASWSTSCLASPAPRRSPMT